MTGAKLYRTAQSGAELTSRKKTASNCRRSKSCATDQKRDHKKTEAFVFADKMVVQNSSGKFGHVCPPNMEELSNNDVMSRFH